MSDYTAEKIRQYRKEKGLTQEALADKCADISLMSIRRYETVGEGNRDPQVGDLVKIARALEVKPADLIDPVLSYSDMEVIDENEERHLLDPSVEVLTKEGVMSLVEFENEKQAGRMSDDDLVEYRNANPKSRVDEAWTDLNESGREKAADQVELVAKVPEYRK